MEVIVGLSLITSEWPHKNSRTEGCRNRAILSNGFRVGQKGIADAINIRRRTPRMNALRTSDPMCRRAVTAICADEHWRVDFAPEVLQDSGKQNDCARHVMRKLA